MIFGVVFHICSGRNKHYLSFANIQLALHKKLYPFFVLNVLQSIRRTNALPIMAVDRLVNNALSAILLCAAMTVCAIVECACGSAVMQ